jgi:hypothetical protein
VGLYSLHRRNIKRRLCKNWRSLFSFQLWFYGGRLTLGSRFMILGRIRKPMWYAFGFWLLYVSYINCSVIFWMQLTRVKSFDGQSRLIIDSSNGPLVAISFFVDCSRECSTCNVYYGIQIGGSWSPSNISTNQKEYLYASTSFHLAQPEHENQGGIFRRYADNHCMSELTIDRSCFSIFGR